MAKYNIPTQLKNLLVEALKDLEKQLGRKATSYDLVGIDPETGEKKKVPNFVLEPGELEIVKQQTADAGLPPRIASPGASDDGDPYDSVKSYEPTKNIRKGKDPDGTQTLKYDMEDTAVDDFSATFVDKASDALTAALQSRMDDFHGDEEKVKKAVEDELRKVVRGMI